MKAFMIAGLLALSAGLACAATPQPSSFSATYTASKGSMSVGEMQRSLAPAGNGNFIFKSEMQATGIMAAFVKDQITESSRWSLPAGLPQPSLYSYQKSGGKKSRNINLQFDWGQSVAQNTVPGKEWKVALEPGTQDKLSYQVALMYDLQRGKTTLAYPIADKNELKHYRFHVTGQEKITTPAGAFDTVRLERIMDSSEKTTTLWCAPSLHYLPVRIEQNEKGSEYSFLLESVQGLGR